MQEKNLRSIFCIVAGGVLVLFPYASIRWLMMALGVVALVYGISSLNRQPNQIKAESIVSIIVGIFFIISPRFILGLLPTVLGVFILIYGIAEIQKALKKRRFGHAGWIFDLTAAILLTLLGISLLTNPFGLVEVLVKVAGLLIIFEGLMPLIRSGKGF